MTAAPGVQVQEDLTVVVKIQSSHPRMEGTLSYNQRKVERGVARVVCAVNLPSAFPEDIRRTFARYENRNRVTDRVSFQLSINPDPSRGEERLSDDEVRAFAATMMNGLGYGAQPYVVYEHRDIDRTHYHVVSIRTDWEGKKIRDYREQYRCQRLLKENAQLFHYRVGEGTGRKNECSVPRPVRFDPKAGDIRNQYLSLFRESCSYRFTTLAQLRAVCSGMGLLLDTRDTPEGVEVILQGAGKDGRPVAQRISGRELGEDLYAQFEARAMECSQIAPVSRGEKARIGRAVSFALARSRDEKAFRSILEGQGIGASLFRTRDGDIYGATFVDVHSKTTLKGSELPDITTKAYREADDRWRAEELRQEAQMLTAETLSSGRVKSVPDEVMSRDEDASSEAIEEVIVEERNEDALDVALGAVAGVLGKAGDFGSASKDDGAIYRKKKKKVIRRLS